MIEPTGKQSMCWSATTGENHLGVKSPIGSPQCHTARDTGLMLVPLDVRAVACSHLFE